MKPDKIILYDEACPMCGIYTGLFVRWKWLVPEGRQPFCRAQAQQVAGVDWQRARHEIPLLSPQGGPTLYGVDALLELIGRPHPGVLRLAALPPIHALLKILYHFISYNRRVLAGSRGALESAPDLHRGWRLAWLVPAFVFTLLTGFRWPPPDTAPTKLACLWAGLLVAGGIVFMRGWDAWGRWASHAVLGSALWSLVILVPPGPGQTTALIATLSLLGLEARHRFF